VAELGQIAANFFADLEELALLEPSADRAIAACSGGGDSTALVHVCAGRFAALTVAHVDHGLRPGSERDAEQVAALAAAVGADFRALTVVVDRGRASLEEAAREARYAALDALADELDAPWVLTGHTASDQVETVLMRIVRGTGVVGLAGIPARRGRYLRPLLAAYRDDVMRYLRANGLEALADPMNEDEALTRNRARRRWLPALRRENPAIDEAVLRLARAAREQREVLDYAADHMQLTADGIAGAPDAVAKRALARAAVAAGAGPLSAVHLDELLAMMRRPSAGTIDLALPGLTARREYGQLRFVHAADITESGPPRLEVSGEGGPYAVRLWRAGDRMRPERLRGRSRKLSDLFIDAKVPREQRARARVVSCERDGAIVWAEHIGVAFEATVVVALTRPRAVATNR